MHAIELYHTAPLGCLIRFSDGTPRPPDRFTRKVKAWEEKNGTGRLVEYRPGSDGRFAVPATFGLHIATYLSGGVPIIVFRRIYSVRSPLDFEIVEQPATGMARVLTGRPHGEELRHLSANEEAAQTWLAGNCHHDARIEIVAGRDAVDRPLLLSAEA